MIPASPIVVPQAIPANTPLVFATGLCSRVRILAALTAPIKIEQSSDGVSWLELPSTTATGDIELQAHVTAKQVRLSSTGTMTVAVLKDHCRDEPTPEFPVFKTSPCLLEAAALPCKEITLDAQCAEPITSITIAGITPLVGPWTFAQLAAGVQAALSAAGLATVVTYDAITRLLSIKGDDIAAYENANVTVECTPGGGGAPVNSTTPPNSSAAPGDPMSINAAAWFTEPDGDTVTYSMTGPTGLVINPTSGLITGPAPSEAGSPYTIVVTATDADGAATATFTLTVSAAALTCSPAVTLNGDNAVDVVLTANFANPRILVKRTLADTTVEISPATPSGNLPIFDQATTYGFIFGAAGSILAVEIYDGPDEATANLVCSWTQPAASQQSFTLPVTLAYGNDTATWPAVPAAANVGDLVDIVSADNGLTIETTVTDNAGTLELSLDTLVDTLPLATSLYATGQQSATNVEQVMTAAEITAACGITGNPSVPGQPVPVALFSFGRAGGPDVSATSYEMTARTLPASSNVVIPQNVNSVVIFRRHIMSVANDVDWTGPPTHNIPNVGAFTLVSRQMLGVNASRGVETYWAPIDNAIAPGAGGQISSSATRVAGTPTGVEMFELYVQTGVDSTSPFVQTALDKDPTTDTGSDAPNGGIIWGSTIAFGAATTNAVSMFAMGNNYYGTSAQGVNWYRQWESSGETWQGDVIYATNADGSHTLFAAIANNPAASPPTVTPAASNAEWQLIYDGSAYVNGWSADLHAASGSYFNTPPDPVNVPITNATPVELASINGGAWFEASGSASAPTLTAYHDAGQQSYDYEFTSNLNAGSSGLVAMVAVEWQPAGPSGAGQGLLPNFDKTLTIPLPATRLSTDTILLTCEAVDGAGTAEVTAQLGLTSDMHIDTLIDGVQVDTVQLLNPSGQPALTAVTQSLIFSEATSHAGNQSVSKQFQLRIRCTNFDGEAGETLTLKLHNVQCSYPAETAM